MNPDAPALADGTLIDDPDGLDALVQRCRKAETIALDSESNSSHVYRERLCLLQMNVDGALFIVDLLALPSGVDGLPGLRDILADPARPLLLHGGEFDVACFKRDYGLALRGIWDSQQAASFLGWPKTGYGAVVQEICGVELPKAYSRYDWGKRPIDSGPLRYAIDDVRYLPAIAQHLRAAIADADLEEELAIANAVVEEGEWNGGFSDEGFWKIKGVRQIPSKNLPVLVALHRWRDQVAEAADLPPGRILNNQALLVLARHAPTNFQSLRKAGLRGGILRNHGDALLDTIKAARQDPPAVPARPRHREVDPAEEARGDRLKSWRRQEANRRQVPLAVVLPSKSMDHLKRHGAGDLGAVPQLGPKRTARYGDQLRRLCDNG